MQSVSVLFLFATAVRRRTPVTLWVTRSRTIYDHLWKRPVDGWGSRPIGIGRKELALATCRQSRAPLVLGHIVYLFPKKIWLALDATRYIGGRTTVGDVKKDDRLANSRFGATLAIPVTKRHSVKLYASTGVETRTGDDFDIFGMAWQYRWGGGL